MTDVKQDSETERIEQLVRARRAQAAKKRIQAFLKSRGDLASTIQACEWYRRLGWFREAYLLIAPKRWRLTVMSTRDPEGRLLLWCARFLNLQGATAYALAILKRLQCHTSQDFRVAATIYLSAYDYANAVGYFRRAQAIEPDPGSYPARMGLIGLCDGLAGLNRYKEAIERVRGIPAHPDEKLLHGILLQAEGEYLAGTGEFKSALRKFEAARPYFATPDPSPDHALLFKWLGYVKGSLGDLREAKALFKSSLRILKAPHIRAEAWLEVHRLMFQLGLLPNREVAYLSVYPGLPEAFLARKGMPQESFLAAKPGKERIRIDPSRDEWVFRGKHHLRVPKEVALIGLLKRSGHHGISLMRLKPLLWPGEVGAFLQLDQRIFQLLKRIRETFRLRARVRDGVVALEPESLAQVAVEADHAPALPSYYEKNPIFSARDFAKYYGLGKTRASIFLKNDLENGRLQIEPSVGAARFLYRVRLSGKP